jgi:hypothetical protein
MGRIFSGLLFIAYVVVGVIVAQSNDYLAGLDSFESILSAVLAILLWPLVLLDVNLQIGDGSGEKPPDGGSSGDKKK